MVVWWGWEYHDQCPAVLENGVLVINSTLTAPVPVSPWPSHLTRAHLLVTCHPLRSDIITRSVWQLYSCKMSHWSWYNHVWTIHSFPGVRFFAFSVTNRVDLAVILASQGASFSFVNFEINICIIFTLFTCLIVMLMFCLHFLVLTQNTFSLEKNNHIKSCINVLY